MSIEPKGIETEIAKWFARKIPKGWFAGPPDVSADEVEVLVVGELPDEGVRRFREETRDRRVEIAREAEALFGRKVSWGVRVGDRRYLFTSLAAPVMTRLRLPERRLLDTLVDAGVARSRSEALAWCVRLVGTHEADWLKDLEDALTTVRKVRTEGPSGPAERRESPKAV